MRTISKRAGYVLIAAFAVLLLGGGAAPGQEASSATDTGLLPLIPPEAVLFVERRGHQAVRQAFLDSNFGRLAMDDAINQFVHDSRRRIGRMIVAELLKLSDDQEIEQHRTQLHELLKPFWYKPAAMFIVIDPAAPDAEPSVGFLCQPGNEYERPAGDAMAALMAAACKQSARRKPFTHSTGMFRWEGVVSADESTTIPADPQARAKVLKDRDLFLVSRSMSLLTFATDLTAAEALEKAVSRAAKDENPSVKTVLAKTAIKDWAFRWYFDMRAVQKLVAARGPNETMEIMNRMLGLDGIRGAGGTGGYVDKMYARLTYVDAPDARTGLTRLLKRGGSYRKAMSMTPSPTAFSLAGELDPGELARMLRAIVTPPPQTAPAATQPRRRGYGPSEKDKKVVEQLRLLAEASDGNAGIFVTDLQGLLMGMGMPGGRPVGIVAGLKDSAKAVRAIDALVKLAGPAPEGMPPGPMPPGMARPAMPKEYRNVPIRYAGRRARLAVMKDRVVIAMGDGAVKAAIDAALDDTGGFEPDSSAEKLARSLGGGAGVFQVDLRAMVKLLWPMAIQVAQMDNPSFPFTSLPSTNKMVRLLGPEIAVFEPTPDGLLIRSRGTVPFITKLLPYPMAGFMGF